MSWMRAMVATYQVISSASWRLVRALLSVRCFARRSSLIRLLPFGATLCAAFMLLTDLPASFGTGDDGPAVGAAVFAAEQRHLRQPGEFGSFVIAKPS